jgi:tetratricopeptide (TPR) repeat protein
MKDMHKQDNLVTPSGLIEKASKLLKKKKFPEAISIYDKILKLTPYDVACLYLKGNALFEIGKHEEALGLYEKIAGIDINYISADTWNSKGNAFLNLMNYKSSISCYNRALKVNKKHFWAWRNKGLAYQYLGQFKKADECYDKALKINPDYSTALNDKGVLALEQGKYAEAISWYKKALDFDENQQWLWGNLGNAYYYLGQYDEASEFYLKAVEIDPNYTVALNGLGNIQFNKNNFSKAIEYYNKALEIDPCYIWAWCNKGSCLSRLERHAESEESFNQCIKYSEEAILKNPSDIDAWIQKARSFYELNKLEQALESFEHVLKIKPSNFDALNGLIIIYSEKYFDNRKALHYTEKALEINPEDFSSMMNYIELRIKVEEYDSARKDAEKLLTRATDDKSRCILRYFILITQIVSGTQENIDKEFSSFCKCFKELPEDFKIDGWEFTGLIESFAKSSLNLQTKFMLIMLINILQGKISKADLCLNKLFTE